MSSVLSFLTANIDLQNRITANEGQHTVITDPIFTAPLVPEHQHNTINACDPVIDACAYMLRLPIEDAQANFDYAMAHHALYWRHMQVTLPSGDDPSIQQDRSRAADPSILRDNVHKRLIDNKSGQLMV